MLVFYVFYILLLEIAADNRILIKKGFLPIPKCFRKIYQLLTKISILKTDFKEKKPALKRKGHQILQKGTKTNEAQIFTKIRTLRLNPPIHPTRVRVWESANSHNSNKLLDLTSWNPRIHHKHISLFLLLAHSCPFSSFRRAITPRAINSFVRRRGYVSNTSGQLFSLPLIFVLREVGKGQILFLGIREGSCINLIWEEGGPLLFSQKKF